MRMRRILRPARRGWAPRPGGDCPAPERHDVTALDRPHRYAACASVRRVRVGKELGDVDALASRLPTGAALCPGRPGVEEETGRTLPPIGTGGRLPRAVL